jgi:TRAP-type C4-dicarboxylate transport system substrate-binding protein
VFERKTFEDRSTGALEEAKKNGLTFVDLQDRDKWVDAVRPVWDQFAKATPGASELIKIIQST